MTFPPLLFVTGTDTNVGKTLVTSLLALRLKSRGVRVGVMKPFASGCVYNEHRVLESDDATFLRDAVLRDAVDVEDDLDLINPCRWEESLTPLVASRRENTPFRNPWDEVQPALNELKKRHECVIVEGVGGLLAPIFQTENGAIWTNREIIDELGCVVVVAARRTLGTINHTIMTCRTELKSPSHFAGIVWCDAQLVHENDIAAQTSAQIVEEMSGLKSWGNVPFLESLEHRVLEDAAQRFLNWPL